jgi:hypothetical protein
MIHCSLCVIVVGVSVACAIVSASGLRDAEGPLLTHELRAHGVLAGFHLVRVVRDDLAVGRA